jgi:hypothetical protein
MKTKSCEEMKVQFIAETFITWLLAHKGNADNYCWWQKIKMCKVYSVMLWGISMSPFKKSEEKTDPNFLHLLVIFNNCSLLQKWSILDRFFSGQVIQKHVWLAWFLSEKYTLNDLKLIIVAVLLKCY